MSKFTNHTPERKPILLAGERVSVRVLRGSQSVVIDGTVRVPYPFGRSTALVAFDGYPGAGHVEVPIQSLARFGALS